MSLSIKLPKTLGVNYIRDLLQVCGKIRSSTENVELDCSEVSFIDPLGLTLLSSTLETIDPSRKISMPWLSVNLTSYLSRMDFFLRRNIDGVDIIQQNRNNRKDRLVELTILTDSAESERVAERMATAITGSITKRTPKNDDFSNPDTEYYQYYDPIRYSISELLENALTHARRQGKITAAVWLAAQYYSPDRVHISVVDNGCGFLGSLSAHPELQEKTHSAAIQLALKPRISCNRDMGPFASSENQGVGLTTTYRISKESAGEILIASGDSLFHDSGEGYTRRNKRISSAGSYWQGVAISATFTRANLPLIRIPELLPDTEGSTTDGNSSIALRFVD